MIDWNKIGSCMFDGCTAFGSVNIPEGVTSIDDRAFYGCSSLTSVTIPDSVSFIDRSAFLGIDHEVRKETSGQ